MPCPFSERKWDQPLRLHEVSRSSGRGHQRSGPSWLLETRPSTHAKKSRLTFPDDCCVIRRTRTHVMISTNYRTRYQVYSCHNINKLSYQVPCTLFQVPGTRGTVPGNVPGTYRTRYVPGILQQEPPPRLSLRRTIRVYCSTHVPGYKAVLCPVLSVLQYLKGTRYQIPDTRVPNSEPHVTTCQH